MVSFNGVSLGEPEPLDGPRYFFINGEALRYALEQMGVAYSPDESVDVDACELWGHLRDWLDAQRQQEGWF